MPGSTDDLTPAQATLNAALELNDAVNELITLAQAPGFLTESSAFDGAVDQICAAIVTLAGVYPEPAADLVRLADAAGGWLRGDDL